MMKHTPTPTKPLTFQPLSTERLNQMAHVATQYRQRVSVLGLLKNKLRGLGLTRTWVLVPTGAFAATAMLAVMLTASPAPQQTDEGDLFAQLDQAEFLVMLEENSY